jgi:hypothetical protein
MASVDATDLLERAVRVRANLYKQLREQLLLEISRYRQQGNQNLADILSHSMAE